MSAPTPVSRRTLLAGALAGPLAGPVVAASASVADASAVGAPVVPHAPGGSVPLADGPIRKPLPDDLFTVFGTNAETKWSALRETGYHTPARNFFVRNHTSTPVIDPATWRLQLHGSGLRAPVTFTLAQLERLPSEEISAFIECTGNGRSFYTTQQGQTVSGTAWKLGAVGVARWRGVRLRTLLRHAGLTRDAVSVMPVGLDDEWVSEGTNYGHVRRPLPIGKALDDALLAYEMNGRPLPPDHGFPLRLVVPNWIGIASIKWIGSIEVSASPLASPWDTKFYRYFGPDYPAEGSAPLTEQVVKSAFELPFPATFTAGRRYRLTGRSWSGHGAVRRVEISTDGGATWRQARPRPEFGAARSATRSGTGWLRWELPWRPSTPGSVSLLARATDATGARQPSAAHYNTLGYLFDGVVEHPATVVGS